MPNIRQPEEFAYRKLKGRIVEKYNTQREFAECVGITKNAMSRKMNGKTMLSQRDIELWCQLLEIDKDDIGEYFFT